MPAPAAPSPPLYAPAHSPHRFFMRPGSVAIGCRASRARDCPRRAVSWAGGGSFVRKYAPWRKRIGNRRLSYSRGVELGRGRLDHRNLRGGNLRGGMVVAIAPGDVPPKYGRKPYPPRTLRSVSRWI